MKILSGIDLPYAHNCGSMIVCENVYGNLSTKEVNYKFVVLESDLTLENQNWIKVNVNKSLSYSDGKLYKKILKDKILDVSNNFIPDILHCHHLCFGMTDVLLSTFDCPSIGFCHGTDIMAAMEDKEHCDDFIRNCMRLDFICFPSVGIMNDCQKILEIPPEKCHVIPWGIPDKYFEQGMPKPYFIPDQHRLVYAGRFHSGKRVDHIIKVMKYLAPEYSLDIYGNGDEKLNYQNLISSLNLNSRVNIHEWVSRDELRGLLPNYHLMLLFSEQIEAFGLSVVEAQALGLPVLVSNQSGLPDVVPNINPKLCADINLDCIARSIRCIFESNEIWNKVSLACFDNARQFSLEKCVESILNLSEIALNSREFR